MSTTSRYLIPGSIREIPGGPTDDGAGPFRQASPPTVQEDERRTVEHDEPFPSTFEEQIPYRYVRAQPAGT